MYVMFACDVCTLTVKRHYTADLRPRNTESCVIYLFSPVQGRNNSSSENSSMNFPEYLEGL